MTWGALLQPDLVLNGSILSLTPDLIEKHGLKGLVLDVDETLVPFRMTQASAEILEWANAIKTIASICLVSNNLSESRIRSIAESLAVPYIFGARKPSRRKLRQAVKDMDIPVEQTAMVGDRLFTDVLAGNRLGMFTILVEPMEIPDQVVRRYPVRTAEIWLSRALGATLSLEQENVAKPHKS